MTTLEKVQQSIEMQEVVEFNIRPEIQPGIPLHLWGDGFHPGDATTEQCIEEAAKVGITPDFEIEDEYDRNEDCVERFIRHLDSKMKTAIENYDWASFLVEKDRNEVGDEIVRLLYKNGEEIASACFENNSAAIYRVNEKFIVHHKDEIMPGMLKDDLYVFDTIYEAADKIVWELFEDEFSEKIAAFFDENVKGCDYKGDCRPHHAIYLNCDTLGLFEMYQASSNYTLQSNSVKIFDNGHEGGFGEASFDGEGDFEDWWQVRRDEIVEAAIENFHTNAANAAEFLKYRYQGA